MKAWLLGVGAALLVASAHALPFAWVSWVMDGDTVLLLPEGEREPVRLRIQGIDAPESCQVLGERSREALMALVLRKTVQVEWHDPYNTFCATSGDPGCQAFGGPITVSI